MNQYAIEVDPIGTVVRIEYDRADDGKRYVHEFESPVQVSASYDGRYWCCTAQRWR